MFRYGFFNTVPMTSSERSKYSVQRKLKNEASRTYISDKNTRPNQTIQYRRGNISELHKRTNIATLVYMWQTKLAN